MQSSLRQAVNTLTEGVLALDLDPRLSELARRVRRRVRSPQAPEPAPFTAGALRLELGGKLALVTGGSGQLGRVMVRTLAACGADVAIHYRSNAGQAEQLRDEVRALGRRSSVAQADVGDKASVAALVERVRSDLGDPDIVVVNAVEQIHPWTEVLEEAIEDYESQFRSCVLQSVLLAKQTLPAMMRRGWGRFIGINTECSMQVLPRMSAYTAGKRGMDAVFRVLAREVGGDGITVNQVAPGWTVSENDRAAGVDDREYARNVPLKRRGTDQEIANVVAFLASDLASFVHGVYLPVCGGNVMPCI